MILLLQLFVREKNILGNILERMFSVLSKPEVCQRHQSETNYCFEQERESNK